MAMFERREQDRKVYYSGAQTIIEYLKDIEKDVFWCKTCIQEVLVAQAKRDGVAEEFPDAFYFLEREYVCGNTRSELINTLKVFKEVIAEE